MNIERKDVLTLDDDHEYVVVSKINYDNKTYYYLADLNDFSNLKFCYQDISLDELVEIKNGAMIQKLIPLFKSSLDNLNS